MNNPGNKGICKYFVLTLPGGHFVINTCCPNNKCNLITARSTQGLFVENSNDTHTLAIEMIKCGWGRGG